MNLSILITENAKIHFQKLIANSTHLNNGNEKQYLLELQVKKSGCSGYSYVINIVRYNDISNNIQHKLGEVFEFSQLPVFIFNKDKLILNNLLIDLKKEGLNNKIIFENPNTINECGCGESFGIKKDVLDLMNEGNTQVMETKTMETKTLHYLSK